MKAINWGLPLAGHKLDATPIATSKVSNRIQCMAKCTKTQGCVSINLGPSQAGEHECALLDTTRYGSTFRNLTVAAGWTYMGPKTRCDAKPCPDKQEIRCIAGETENDYSCMTSRSETSCQQFRDTGETNSGIYTLSSSLGLQFKVYCEMDTNGKGWIVFMKNDAKTTNYFIKDWATFENGFGDLNSNQFWLGNEFLHQITKDKQHELQVDLRKAGAADTYAFYSGFQVSDKSDGYRLTFDTSSYQGDAGDNLKSHNNMKFTTQDKDLDTYSGHCGEGHKVGWWYYSCWACLPTRNIPYWGTSLDFIQLKIRPMDP
ncbi:ficolin-1-B-like [Dendronephthya gigantea]|uniref:ficolin-1-B-like n=1 Tax=Dendronephthya gigantea TaxID=151771 RepID=UPI001069574B|nr:ficolin-1-B-like [Dendronephthya gigantea]